MGNIKGESESMKKIALITISLLCSIVILAQGVKGFVNKQLQTYPQLRLLDLYKSCFQDYMGAEHLVSDRQRVKAYLDDELNTTSIDDLMPWNYEPCGIDSNYYRVSIRTIKESVISEDLLLDAFIRSANSKKRPTVDSWRDRWHVIIGTIDKMQLELPYYQQDKAFIDSILSVGRYAISHSPEYREAYHPHYRIVERGIFERELKPLIERKYLQNKNNNMDDKKQIIDAAIEHFGATLIDIEAQEYAKGFYEGVGFKQSSDTFMLDGIPHIKMTWRK
jgi:hypothetical protein